MDYVVAVRTLCEFAARQGDLDFRFTPSPTAVEGMAGHAAVRARRGPDYAAEVSLTGQWEGLRVRGRADGFDAAAGRVEEIKTHRGRLDTMPANQRSLHWAQAKVYGWLLCQERELDSIEVALVYFDLATQTETVLVEACDASSLKTHFESLCSRFLGWARQESAHRAARDAALEALTFPLGELRAGQRPLAEAVYRGTVAGRCLMAQAPTGVGKTLGTLFPMLKAAPRAKLDKVFFLTAKTPGRQLALDGLDRLRGQGPLRVLELVARDKACEHPDKACHGDSCPLARGFYDRLPAAREEAAQLAWLDREATRAVARRHAICPYYLAQEMARWTDVAVGDYNYYFDLNAMLFALTVAGSWRVGVLADEAHNLVERLRAMYSATLTQDALSAARRVAPASLRPALDRVRRQWKTLTQAQAEPYAVYETIPEGLLDALQQACSAVTDLLAQQPDAVLPPLLDGYFDMLHFCRLADAFDAGSLFDQTLKGGADDSPKLRDSILCLRNVVPAAFVRPRLAAAHCATLFSATLEPVDYYRDMLGLPADTGWIDVPSPFGADQLQVRVARDVSTRFTDRVRSSPAIVTTIATQYDTAPGNYLAFFSSYDYLDQVADALVRARPDIPVWRQSRRMDEQARAAFLERFATGGRGIGFAVLGGAFAEGVDLPGDRLIGAFVATLGMPQVNPVNEQIRARMQQHFGAGYEYTYLYPGVQKVVQAAGRVIRTTEDRGVVHLLDDRFATATVRRLLPAWWAPDVTTASATSGRSAMGARQPALAIRSRTGSGSNSPS